MSKYMEELAAAWVGWLRHRNAVQEKVINLIQAADERLQDDEELRKSELKRLQRSFYKVAIADKLREKKKFEGYSPEHLLKLADELLDKRVCVSGLRGRPSDMRTPDEERDYSAARVQWSNLLKKAQVRAADPRGGDTSRYRLR